MQAKHHTSAPRPLLRGALAAAAAVLPFLFVPQTEARTPLPDLPEGLASFGAAVAGDSLYVFGGHVGKTHRHSLEHLSHRFLRLDLERGGDWEELPLEYGLQGVELLSDGQGVLRIGGLSARNRDGEPEDLHSLASVSRFDPDLGIWRPLPSLPQGRSSHGAALLDGKVYVVGGWQKSGQDGSEIWHDSAFVLDLGTRPYRWQALPAQPFRRRALVAAALDGKVYAVGGITPDDGVSNRVDIYDVAAGTWSRGPDLPAADGLKGFGAAAFAVGGKLYCSPGDGGLYRLSHDGAYWEDTGLEIEPKRFFHRLVGRGADRLLIIAGASREGHLRTVQEVHISSLVPPGDSTTRVQAAGSRVWPEFRGDGSSRTQARDLPLAWSSSENLGWSVDLPGYGQSSPVIWQDRVFVTAVEGEEKETNIVAAFDLASGRELWRRVLPASQRIPTSEYVSRAAPTPAVDGERLYVFFESGDLAAMSHDGEVLWQRSLTDEYGPFKGNHGVGASVALQAGAVVILVQHEGPSYLLSVDRESGQNYWKTDTRQRVSWSSPLVLESRERSEILLSSNGALESYDADSGEMLWSVEGLEGNTIPSPSAQGDLVIVASTAGEHSMAVRRGGHGEVTASHVAWRAVSAAASFASPLIHEGCAYFVNRAGVVRCLEPESGEEIWTFRLPGPCWASPLGAGDRVYFFTKDGETVVLRAGTSEPEVLASSKLPTEGPVYGIAAVDGAIVVRTGQQLLRLGASPTSVASR